MSPECQPDQRGPINIGVAWREAALGAAWPGEEAPIPIKPSSSSWQEGIQGRPRPLPWTRTRTSNWLDREYEVPARLLLHHEAATALARVEGPVKQLERLIAELLDVSKIQAGRLEYLQEPVDLDALLRETTDTMQHLNPSHTLVVRGAAQTSLIGDRDRLGQVFTNLLSNAIKYSPDAKTVEVDLSTSPETVKIRVHDHGLGIQREQRDKIFDRFYRATDPKQRAIPGLGMGFYIVAEIAKRHGGTITVDSAVGKGSTFTVTLPRTRNV